MKTESKKLALRAILFSLILIAPLALVNAEPTTKIAPRIQNPHISYDGFKKVTNETEELRSKRLLTEADFLEMASDADTIVLDTRSEKMFTLLHLKGAKHLNFSDFGEAKLAKLIPSKDTRILIYCNNNFLKEPRAFPTKAISVPLNIPTFINLHAYGYKNVYELGPLVDPQKSNFTFEGTLADENGNISSSKNVSLPLALGELS